MDPNQGAAPLPPRVRGGVSDHSRSTATIRWSRTVTRALHIPAVALVIGAWWLEQPALALGWPLSLAVATGALIGFLFFFQSKAWLLEVRGAVVIAKVGLLALLPFLSATAGVWLLVTMAFVASVAAHMPGRYRHLRIDRWIRR